MRRNKTQFLYLIVVVIIVCLVYFFGAFDHMSEVSFRKHFDYPLEGKVLPLVEQVRFDIEPDIAPINRYDHPFLSRCGHKCANGVTPRLVILVKSAMEHFERRAAIRRTWGLQHRFNDVTIRTVFFLGVTSEPNPGLQSRIEREINTHNDIVQSQFVDSYFNNTIKTMMAFRWAYEHCPMADFYLFADDDMFVSVRNVLRFVEDPGYYPDSRIKRYKRAVAALPVGVLSPQTNGMHVVLAPYANFSLFRKSLERREKVDSDVLFAGFVFKSSPHRHLSSKWYVSLEEYPYDMWPPYVTAGAYVLSNEGLKIMYAGSMFVKHFRFDDIYLGIVALKLGIEPLHCKEFYYYKKPYTPKGYSNLIASHGYDDPDELERIWTQQLTGAKV